MNFFIQRVYAYINSHLLRDEFQRLKKNNDRLPSEYYDVNFLGLKHDHEK